MARTAFIGLGAMGAPMAGHLSKKHKLFVFNRSFAKMRAWSRHYKGVLCKNVRETVTDADALITCVGTDDELREVILTHALPVMKKGALIIDHSTSSAHLARHIHDVASQKGIGFCDAPVSGGVEGARQGTLSIMMGGNKEHVVRTEPYLSCYGAVLTHIGEAGCGQLAKIVNQICVAGVLQSLAEGLHFARSVGLDGDKLLQAIGGGAASSWQMTNRASTMLKDEFDFGFKVDWMVKDLTLALEEAARASIDEQLAMTQKVLSFYVELQKMNGGEWDTSALIKRLTIDAHSWLGQAERNPRPLKPTPPNH